MNKRMVEMLACFATQKLNEWYPYITIEEYVFMLKIVEEEKK